MGNPMCFECLQRCIREDLSDRLIFCYGLSDSHLPFGSTAVVRLESSSAEPSPEFVVKYVPYQKGDCLAKFIDEHCSQLLEFGDSNNAVLFEKDHDQAEASIGLSGDKTTSLDNTSTECQDFLKGCRNTSTYGLGCEKLTCKFFGRFSCFRAFTALVPTAQIGISPYPLFEDLASHFLSGSIEDHILRSLTHLVEGKASGRDSVNFLRLVGTPSFTENNFPGCIRHPNISPIFGMLKTSSQICLVLPKTAHTLENVIHYSPGALKSDWHMRFLIYQLLSALAYMHGLGVTHGNLSPSCIALFDLSWCWLPIADKFLLSSYSSAIAEACKCLSHSGFDACFSQGLYADLRLSQYKDWHSSFNRWWKGEISNFEYLLILNKLAGRRWGDHAFYTVMPWVVDFCVEPDENNDAGWRDLCKSKWRLAKGDEQLDFTYSTSEIPHHVSDECLSELAVCSYKARRLPLSVLRMAVRSVYEPNEYPSNMQRLYQWTPDECIPEFYCDSQIFHSIHPGMSDLAVPSWAGTPEHFIKLHRNALESNRVSSQIHNWIDITFGYKMSGQAAVAAKNVMLPASVHMIPRSMGRRQLFTRPHPPRLVGTIAICDRTNGSTMCEKPVSYVAGEASFLQELEEATLFSEHSRMLSPLYYPHLNDAIELDCSVIKHSTKNTEYPKSSADGDSSNFIMPSVTDLNYLLKNIEVGDDTSVGYQELLLWRQKSSFSSTASQNASNDIFAVGCILAELHLRRPLFDPTSLGVYLESGVLPRMMQELPPETQVFVEACVHKDWRRRPSAKCLLESPYFPSTIRASYIFLAPLQLLATDKSRLCYAATFAKKGAFRAMGPFASEMCAPNCLKFLLNPLTDAEAEWGCIILTEFLRCLNPIAIKKLLVPAIQKILQAVGPSHLKISILQGSFVQEIWDRIGKQAYLETIHPLVISNLFLSSHKTSAAAASVLLIGSSEELGIPIMVHQTIMPLIYCFGKGLCDDGTDVVVRIGCLIGENFIVKQILPLLRSVIQCCIDNSNANKPEPIQSWSASALTDCLTTLDGLIPSLPREMIVRELIEDGKCLHLQVLMQDNLGIQVLQVTSRSLIAICQQIGPDLTTLHVLPTLKELFDDLAFSQEKTNRSEIQGGKLRVPRIQAGEYTDKGSYTDIVLFLYPSFASLLGIEKLRQCCTTWLLLEQFLLRNYNWKWESISESSRCRAENSYARRPTVGESFVSGYSPANMLLKGAGWSTPQSQGHIGTKNLVPNKNLSNHHPNSGERQAGGSDFGTLQPWYWFPGPMASSERPDLIGRHGGPKDEFPWKIRASILHSVRAHHGVLRSIAVCQDECSIFTAGVGAGFKGTVQKWELSRVDSVSGYYGHEEVVNDICILTSSGRVASCDGTVHVWNGQTGKLVSVFSEFSNSMDIRRPPSNASKSNADQANTLHFNSLSSGILNTAFDSSLYTSMHYLEFLNMLAVGTGNGSLRFIDVRQGQKLHLWRSEAIESNFPSLTSSICSCGSTEVQVDGATTFPSWIAVGQSSGHCRLFDLRSGNIIASWQAHDGFVTKLAAPEAHLLISSSLDRTLRIWDLRRNWTSKPLVSRGHSDGVSGFSVWGQDVISISRNKIGLSCLARSADEEGQHVVPQYLYMGDGESRNMSVLSSISILPFSRLFVVGTEDGHLKICC
ncbi:PREDICTED: protein GFS12 isoform X1 [Ipomoea nil]|uniref:protein GFS12 isoform X1 n=2 Tax=Ipomoea nil TaxID=35883 RepID=UPI000901F722|nr:PREDICTED: protein GFS12 isoform X1 [Ipomoea nil]XP_019171267.1 PREDICTED: protein GFS12 isoform X1 [Ipomoea nil]XP_019171268.1 PREDICTED: protein GFS12 isoform X1 [Ipomoea nil]